MSKLIITIKQVVIVGGGFADINAAKAMGNQKDVQVSLIGRIRAIVSTRAFNLKGVATWWVWLFTHILYLSGFKNRLFVFWDWIWSYLTFERGARIIFTSVIKKDRDIA